MKRISILCLAILLIQIGAVFADTFSITDIQSSDIINITCTYGMNLTNLDQVPGQFDLWIAYTCQNQGPFYVVYRANQSSSTEMSILKSLQAQILAAKANGQGIRLYYEGTPSVGNTVSLRGVAVKP